MSESFKTTDIMGASSSSPPFSRYVNHYSLSGGVAQTIVWPIRYSFCNIQSSGDVSATITWYEDV